MIFDWILAGAATAGATFTLFFTLRAWKDWDMFPDPNVTAIIIESLSIRQALLTAIIEVNKAKRAAEIRKIENTCRELINAFLGTKEKAKHVAECHKIENAYSELINAIENRNIVVAEESGTRPISRLRPKNIPKSDKRKDGKVLIETLVYIVPAIVTLAFVGTFLALEIMNNGDPEYQCSETFRASFLIIIGYYFGMGATKVVSNVDDE